MWRFDCIAVFHGIHVLRDESSRMLPVGGGVKPPRAGRGWGSGLGLGSNGLEGIR